MFFKAVKRVTHISNLSATTGRLYYTSAIVAGDAQVIYRLGEWAKPPQWLAAQGYGLFAFDELPAAIHLFENHINPYGLTIFECELRGVAARLPQYLGLYSLERHRVVVSEKQFPEHTVMGMELLLTREILQPRSWARAHGILVI